MILENAFNVDDFKDLVKKVVNEAKDLSYVINVEHGGNPEKLKKHALVFLLEEEAPQKEKIFTRAQKIEETLDILAKDSNYKQIHSTLLHSYNYIRKVAGKEEYKSTKQENPSH